MRPDLILIAVILSLAATASILPGVMSVEMRESLRQKGLTYSKDEPVCFQFCWKNACRM